MKTSKRRLTAAEMGELELLSFRAANDFPFSQEEAERYAELKMIESRRG